jgi:hypothetical protein
MLNLSNFGFPLLWRVLRRRDAALTRGSTEDDVVVKVHKKKKSSVCDAFSPPSCMFFPDRFFLSHVLVCCLLRKSEVKMKSEDQLPLILLMHASSPLCQQALFAHTLPLSASNADTMASEDLALQQQQQQWLSVVHAASASTSNGSASPWVPSNVIYVNSRRDLKKLQRDLYRWSSRFIDSEGDAVGACTPQFRVQHHVPLASLPFNLFHAGSARIPVHCQTCHVLVPSAPFVGSLHHSNVMRSSQLAVTEMKRQYAVRCEMARVMTLGGGWASVKNAQEALKCSIRLYQLAGSIGDEATERKCRVFVGWAMLWHFEHQQQQHQTKGGAPKSIPSSSPSASELQKALWIFTTQLTANQSVNDETNWNRCFAALYHWSFLTNGHEEGAHNVAALPATHEKVVDGYEGPQAVTGGAPTSTDNEDCPGVGNRVLDQWETLFL